MVGSMALPGIPDYSPRRTHTLPVMTSLPARLGLPVIWQPAWRNQQTASFGLRGGEHRV
jgi:hypothetical protein